MPRQQRRELPSRCDVAIIGGGPAGLSAAVAASSEGLETCLFEANYRLGGQAGASHAIENYIGFPEGVSGDELMDRSVRQIGRFGTAVVCPSRIESLVPEGGRFTLQSDTDTFSARAVVIATGLAYRRLDVPRAGEYAGRGIYYGSGPIRRVRQTVAIVGGGNSAGQAALYYSELNGSHVHLIVRASGLDVGMSTYLCDRIRKHPDIKLHPFSTVTGLQGEDRLRDILVRREGQEPMALTVDALLVLIGGTPRSTWLRTVLAVDDHGFILTDRELGQMWPTPSRPPFHLETSVPGVFAAGDVRASSIKRMASAVGEGAAAVQSIHSYLEIPAAQRAEQSVTPSGVQEP